MATYNYQGCWNDSTNRALPNYLGNNMNQQQCEQVAINNNYSVYGLQYYGQCWAGNNLQQAMEYGLAFNGNSSECGPEGSSWTNQVYAAPEWQMPNYQMSPTELTCYQQNNPDLANMTQEQLQQHWTTYGSSEQRNNQCPSYQTSSGLYNYIGCFNDTSNRAIPNYLGQVSSVDECKQLAYNSKNVIFGVQDNGYCFGGNNLTQAQEYGRNVNRNQCGPMGESWTNQVYVRGQPFPPPPPPLPSLTSSNFSVDTS